MRTSKDIISNDSNPLQSLAAELLDSQQRQERLLEQIAKNITPTVVNVDTTPPQGERSKQVFGPKSRRDNR
jgi:hypothetical protein